jgi:esterase/lipase superfamily enzyme
MNRLLVLLILAGLGCALSGCGVSKDNAEPRTTSNSESQPDDVDPDAGDVEDESGDGVAAEDGEPQATEDGDLSSPKPVPDQETQVDPPRSAAPMAFPPEDQPAAEDAADESVPAASPLGAKRTFAKSPESTAVDRPPGDALPAEGPRPKLVDKQLRSVKVFYGTNRARGSGCKDATSVRWDSTTGCVPNDFYSGRPAISADANQTGLEVGTLTVTFPPDHEESKIERPPQIFSYALRGENPEKDVLIMELSSFGHDYNAWVSEVQSTGRDQAFIYVHGFANSFAEAARRAAQVAYDLDFDVDPEFEGLTMMYSWPSLGEANLTAYSADYDSSDAALEAFNQFLDLLKEQARITRVHIIAHSMGNRLVARALTARHSPEKIVDQLVLAAPDIRSSTFKSRFLRTLPQFAQRVTLYVSDNDRALVASSRLRQDEPRAGQVSGGLLNVSGEGFESIDASSLPTDFLGHSYYAENKSVLSDVYWVLRDKRIQDRPLIYKPGPPWRFLSDEEMAASGLADGTPSAQTGRWYWPVTAGGGILAALIVIALVVIRSRRRAA